MIKRLSITLIFLNACCFCIGTSMAQQLKPSGLFCDHMVLQRDVPVPVWGDASPNQKVTVTFAGQTKSTVSDQDGNWRVTLDPLPASQEGDTMKIAGKTEINIVDVVVGEVWICSGQSNMQYSVSNVPEVRGLIPFAKNIRSFEVEHRVALEEQEVVSGQWEATHPTSAVAFSFAYFLNDLTDIPVGIIHTSWGSSSIEAWMPRDMTQILPHFKTIMDEFDADTARVARIRKILASDGWTREEDIFLRRQPNVLYNAMMHPLIPFACRGLVWYQGERHTRYLAGMPEVDESNWFHRVSGMKEYGEVLKKWILNYREQWQDDEMNFMVIMLPGYGKGTMNQSNIDPESPTEPSWAWIRESQLASLDLPHTSVVNTIDLGEIDDVHPKDKLPVGQRGALLAAKNTLNPDILARGPMLRRVDVDGDQLVVHFDYASGLKTIDGKAPTGFWITDDTKKWKYAEAKIEGESVILSSPKVKQPKYIRYAFAGKPSVNLVNANELPAYPFKTDNWKE